MKRNHWLILLFIVLLSCSNEEELIEYTEDQTEKKLALKSADGKYRVLGHGYDITGDYLNKHSIRKVILDLEKLQKDRGQNIIYYNPESGGNNEYYYGYDAYDYLKDITKKSNYNTTANGQELEKNGLKAFSGSITIDKDFQNKYSYSSKYSFASINIIQYLADMRIEESKVMELAKYVTTDFINDLNYAVGNESREDQFVIDYGTHVMTSFSMGGTLSILYRSSIIETFDYSETKNAIKIGLNATLDKIGLGANIDKNVTTIESINKKNKEAYLFVRYKGGKGIDATYNLETGIPTISTTSWVNSVTAENAGLLEMDWNRTYPIYELISEPTKKARIQAAVNRYIVKNQIKVLRLKRLYRVYSNNLRNNFYLFDWKHVQECLGYGDFYDGVDGYILAEAAPNTRPLHRMYSKNLRNTFYVFNMNHVQECLGYGDLYEGIDGYVLINPESDTTRPLYKMYSHNLLNTFYLFDWTKVQECLGYGDSYSGIDGYIYK
ncbi:MAG: hypothetical protein LBS20_18575 [Prevotella sp.]|jgi:hypothetical protein|nr:hypothetical protein [Prevotella sp.]